MKTRDKLLLSLLKLSRYKTSLNFISINSLWSQDSTFLDYIRGGLRINLCVAVDMSGGGATDPTSQDSLHFLHPRTQENVYTTAIRTVGDILQDYDYGMML